MVVCPAALVIADLQLGMTLSERWRLAVLADVAVVTVAAHPTPSPHRERGHRGDEHLQPSLSLSLTDSARQGGWGFLVGYGSSPGPGEVAVLCLRCALAARSSNSVTLVSSVASAVAAVGAITRYRTDSAYRARRSRCCSAPSSSRSASAGTSVPRHEPEVVDAAIGSSRGVPELRRRQDPAPAKRQGRARRAASRTELGVEPPGVLGASEVAVRGADCR